MKRFYLAYITIFFVLTFASAASADVRLGQVFLRLYPSYELTEQFNSHFSFQKERQIVKIKIISDTDLANAFVDIETEEVSSIYLTSTILETIENDHELAFILAHEMSHIVSKDLALPDLSYFVLTEKQKSKIGDYNREIENHADSKARKILLAAGYDFDLAYKILEKIDTSYNPHTFLHTHLDSAKRIAQLR